MHRYRLTLDLQLFNQEKTEPATPRRRQEARKKGQVASSQEIPAAFILLFVFLSFLALGGYYKDRLYRVFGDAFESGLTMELTADSLGVLVTRWMTEVALLLLPIFAIALVIGLASHYFQFGWLFTLEPIKPSLKKISPIQGVKQLFSSRALVEFAKSILKLLIVGLMVYTTIWGELDSIVMLDHAMPEQILAFAASLTLSLGIKIAVLLVVVALFDYVYRRYMHEKSLRMSKQDIKDEHKKVEGDPLIKGRIREKQRRMAIQRMMQEVPKADVVITNPTHYAVALRYDAAEMDAPTVVAKGIDYLALRIREVAKEHDVTIMENKPLARALYERTEIGRTIPVDLFQAVAEVLAYIYRLKGRVKSS
jgi:flagellar biosynthetic protein FlhB